MDDKIYCVMFLKENWNIALCMELLRENNIKWINYEISEFVHIFNTAIRGEHTRVKLSSMTNDVFLFIEA